jgi:hypothetical protein
MALRLGSLRFPWRRSSAAGDPYWDAFINRPPDDVRNMIPEIIGSAPEGNVYPTPTELHSTNVTTSHVKELARYLDTHLVGIVDLSQQPPEIARGYPFAVVCGVRAEHDPATAHGPGGQAPVQNGQFATFIVASWIREMGFRATMKIEVPREQRERLAVAAGLGRLNAHGRLTVPRYATNIYVADIIFTDLPMVADG